MEPSVRRLSFDACNDDDYASCDSSLSKETSEVQVTPSPARSNTTYPHSYNIREMTEDLLGEGNLFDMDDWESMNMNSSPDYDVVPQRLDKFKTIEDPERGKIAFESDYATNLISNEMITEHNMILTRIRHTLGIQEDKYPTLDDLMKYFFGPVSKITTLFLDQLGTDYLTFLKLLSTICILQGYRMSMTLLHHEDGAVDKEIINVSIEWNLFFSKWNNELNKFILS